MAQRMIWAGVLLLACWIRPAAGQTRPLTLAEARQKVRIAAQVRDEDIVRYRTKILGNRVFYHFELRNGDGYQVDRATGRIAVVYESRFSTRTTQEVEANRLPLEVLEKVAWETVRERYPEGAAMTLKLWEQPHFDGYAYSFHYGQVLPENGAWTDNGCTIVVAADTGVLNSYSDHFEPIPPAARRQPHVSAAQAIMIAARATGSADVLEAEPPRLVFGPFSHGRLHWSVKFRGIAPDGRVGMFGVNVDAHSGQPYGISTYSLLTYPRPPKNHTMLARKVLQRRLGPIQTAQGLLVSEKIVAALGGTLGRRSDALEVRGETTVRVKEQHALRQGEEWFIPVDAIRRAFPSKIYVLEAEPERNAVNFICDRDVAVVWYSERGEVFSAATTAPDRSAEIRAAIQKLGLAEPQIGTKGLGRSTRKTEGHVVIRVVIGGLTVILSGLVWWLRTRRPVARMHGG